MQILDRAYTLLDFKFEGNLSKEKGAYPVLQIGFAIEKLNPDKSKLHVVYDYKYNNFDASVIFILQCITEVDFFGERPNEEDIYKELKLISLDADKLIMKECTEIGKYTIPPKANLDNMKDKLMPVIIGEIDKNF